MPDARSDLPDPVPANRAARRRKATKLDPPDLDHAAGRYHGSEGPARPARATAQGRRVNPIRRTG